MISIASTARISPLADIEDSVRGTSIVIGGHSEIDSFVKIKPAGGLADLVIGENTIINSGCVLYTGNGIRIGNNVLVSANCTFAPVNHGYRERHLLIRQQGFKASKGGILVEDDVWIGSNCVLLDGAILRKGCVIGAGTVIRGEVAEYAICAGNPARVIGQRQ
jgi:acetyltransferase-like isoleucine patch superfamily enzyme